MINKKIKFLIIFLLFITICDMRYAICRLYAQEDNKLVALIKQIAEAKTNDELYVPFEQLKDLYFNDNKYPEFLDLLKSLAQKRKTLEPFINYYIALTRYDQLKYLEEKQIWGEYFSQGNTYREELIQGAKNSIDSTTANDPLHIYARLILWQFHKDQQDAGALAALTDLMSSVLEYSKAAGSIKPIKELADKLLSFGEKGKSKELYKLYAHKLVSSNMADDALSNAALSFYNEGNLELSESIYDVYIEKITKSLPKEKSIPFLIDIAKAFSYKDTGPTDFLYAEKIFKIIEELGEKESLNQQLLYLRAFNLEKAKEYQRAKDVYIDFVLAFPETSHSDEAIFKVGIINTYVLRDIKEGRNYFKELIHKTGAFSSWGISSLYQLGLLSQWENDFVGAKNYYNKLIETAAGNYPETVALARERLKEIEEAKPMEYSLKTFLDVSLKEEYSMLDMSKLDLRSHPYKAKKEESVNISSTTYTSPSGCMQIELQYLWSGDLGSKKPSADQAAFDTTYTDIGTKVINLVVVSPTGIIERSLDLVDAY